MTARRRLTEKQFENEVSGKAFAAIVKTFDSEARPIVQNLKADFARHIRSGELYRSIGIRRDRRRTLWKVGIFDSSSRFSRAIVARFFEFGTVKLKAYGYLSKAFRRVEPNVLKKLRENFIPKVGKSS